MNVGVPKCTEIRFVSFHVSCCNIEFDSPLNRNDFEFILRVAVGVPPCTETLVISFDVLPNMMLICLRPLAHFGACSAVAMARDDDI